MNLAELPEGSTAVIGSILLDGVLRKRINAMGIRCGTEVEIIRRAAFNGPIQICLGHTQLILRQDLAKAIIIKN